MRIVKTMISAVALVACFAPGARADEWNKRTYLTFSGPVQVPGKTLPAGTYTFELADPDASRHVIRISEKDTNKHMGLFLTIPQDRLEPPSDNLIMFAERPAGSPQAIKAWFYPGDRIGEEFVYPKSQAQQIAKANNTAVLANESAVPSNTPQSVDALLKESSRVGRVDASGRMTNEDRPAASTTTARATTKTPEPRATTPSRSTGTSGTQNTTASRNRRSELPRTGSDLVLFELLSAIAFGGAAVAHRVRVRATR